MYFELIYNLAKVRFAKNALFESYLLFSGLEGAIAPPRDKLQKNCHAKVAVGNFPPSPKFSCKSVVAFSSY